jgi:ribosomal protein S4
MKIQRYSSLETIGPVFPAHYKYKGGSIQGIKLSPLAEEMLWKLARYVDSDYWKNSTFQINNWLCIKPELSPELQKLNFPEDFMKFMTKAKEIQDKEKETKKNRSKEEKQKENEEKESLKAKYGHCLVDGKPVEIAGYLVEDSNWILTRGLDPRCGMWKYRVCPEDVTINIVNGKAPIDWPGKVESNPKAVWVFKYQILCGRGPKATLLNKVVAFSKNTEIGKQMMGEKYSKAQDILLSWNEIESGINAALKINNPEIQESAVICSIIASTGCRIGNEKNLVK